MYGAPFRDGLDEVRPRQEWSPCRRLDTRYGRCSESTCNSSARFGVKATAAQMALIKLELNPVALQWRRGRIKGCSFNVAVSRREQPPTLRSTSDTRSNPLSPAAQ